MGKITPRLSENRLFRSVEAMLAAEGLEPTPDNYERCYRRCVQTAEQSGRTGSHSSAKPASSRETAVVPEAAIAEVTAAAELLLDQISAALDLSREQTSAFETAIDRQTGSLAEGMAPAAVAGGLTDLTRGMIEQLKALGDHLGATTSEMKTLRQQLAAANAAAETDALTGLHNRRALDRRLSEIVANSIGTTPVAIAMADIDLFKRINDAHGHAIGDAVIKLVARSLARCADGNAFVGRFGGEEFVLIFTGWTAIDVARELDCIRRQLSERALHIKATGERLGHLSFSAGVAGLTEADCIATIIDRVDGALLQAKRDGRNRIEVAAATSI